MRTRISFFIPTPLPSSPFLAKQGGTCLSFRFPFSIDLDPPHAQSFLLGLCSHIARMAFHRLDFVCRGIQSFQGIKEVADNNFVAINVQGNQISDFQEFGTHPYMVSLDARGNAITSFYGLTRQRSLQSLELKGNPVATHPFYRIMALMVIGFSVTDIDGAPITPEERTLARRAGNDAAMAISFGWLLDMKPRTRAAFQEIISECKYVHIIKVSNMAGSTAGAPLKSVATALREIDSPAAPSAAEVSGRLRVQEQDDADSRRTIARLSKRVATLEQMLREASAGSAAASAAMLLGQRHQDPLLMLQYGAGPTAAGQTSLSEVELQDATSMVFADGIATRTNQSPNPVSKRSCVQLSRRTVTVLNFMTRSPTFELKLSGSITVTYRRPKTLVVENRFGIRLEITFEDIDVLRTVFKLLFLLRSKPVPPLPVEYGAEDDRAESASAASNRGAGVEDDAQSRSSSSDSDCGALARKAPASGTPTPSVTSLPSRPAAPPSENRAAVRARPTPAPPVAVPATPRWGHDTPKAADEDEDNIPDVPPLPTPGGSTVPLHIDTAGTTPVADGSGSDILFDIDHDDGSDDAVTPAAAPAALTRPAPPAAPPGRFQSLLIASSDSDTEAALDAAASAPPSATKSAPAAPATRPPIPPKRTDSTVKSSLAVSTSSASPSATARKAPPPVPARRAISNASLVGAPSTVASATTRGAPTQVHDLHVGHSSIDFEVEDTLFSASARSMRTSQRVTPLGSARNSEAAAPPAPPSAPPAKPPSRFASLMVDSDSDSSTG